MNSGHYCSWRTGNAGDCNELTAGPSTTDSLHASVRVADTSKLAQTRRLAECKKGRALFSRLSTWKHTQLQEAESNSGGPSYIRGAIPRQSLTAVANDATCLEDYCPKDDMCK